MVTARDEGGDEGGVPLDGILLTLGGIPAAAALFVGTIIYLVDQLRLGEPLDGSD